MVGGKLFTRRRDGRVEVRMNEYGRSVVRSAFANVLAAERDPDHEWHVSLSGPIDPSLDQDDPVSMLTRQNETSTNAELAGLTVDEQFLNDAEAWVWLTTLAGRPSIDGPNPRVAHRRAIGRGRRRDVELRAHTPVVTLRSGRLLLARHRASNRRTIQINTGMIRDTAF